MSTTTDVRSEILTAAGPIFADVGFEKSTVREIWQRCRRQRGGGELLFRRQTAFVLGDG